MRNNFTLVVIKLLKVQSILFVMSEALQLVVLVIGPRGPAAHLAALMAHMLQVRPVKVCCAPLLLLLLLLLRSPFVQQPCAFQLVTPPVSQSSKTPTTSHV